MSERVQLWLFRHGETEWSRDGKHTSRTDLPLTPAGESQALALRRLLPAQPFNVILSSPLLRSRRTCALLGLGDACVVDDDLREWNYGSFEGRTTLEIQIEKPAWTLWTAPPPDGESAADVGRRADRVIARAASLTGKVALFGHAHMLRVLAARWLELDAAAGRLLALQTGSLSVLGHERDTRVIEKWNQTP